MKIEVTAEDLRLGTPTYGNCPISIAAMRAFNATFVYTQSPKMYVGKGALTGGMYDLPLEAKIFVNAFDQEKEVKPFTFEVGEPL